MRCKFSAASINRIPQHERPHTCVFYRKSLTTALRDVFRKSFPPLLSVAVSPFFSPAEWSLHYTSTLCGAESAWSSSAARTERNFIEIHDGHLLEEKNLWVSIFQVYLSENHSTWNVESGELRLRSTGWEFSKFTLWIYKNWKKTTRTHMC